MISYHSEIIIRSGIIKCTARMIVVDPTNIIDVEMIFRYVIADTSIYIELWSK